MTRARRILITVIAAIPMAVLLALAIVTLVVDPNRFRGEIERRVSDAAGIPFRLPGDIRISWFPWLALSTGAASLGGTAVPGAVERPLVAWQGARFGAKLLPLLRGDLVLDRVRLEKPAFWLHRARDGRANWQALGGSGAVSPNAKAGPAAPPAAPRDAAGNTAFDRLNIAGIEIRDGTLDFIDDGAGSHYHVEALSLDVGAWHTGAEVPVEARFRARTAALTARLSLRARVRADRNFSRIDAAAFHVDGDITGLIAASKEKGGAPPTIPVSFDTPALTAILEPALQLDANSWSAGFAELRLAGSLSLRAANAADGAADVWRGAGRLEASSDELRAVLRRLDIAATPRRDPQSLGRFRATADWQLDGGGLTLAPLTLELDDTRMHGTLVSLPGGPREWRFDLDGDAIDLDRYGESPDVKGEPFELPVATLKALRANGELRLQRARSSGADMKGVRLRVESGTASR